MDVREGIHRRIELKRKELADLELKIREANSYIRALEDTLRLLDGEDGEPSGARSMRPDSDVGRSQEALRRAGKPLHISELLKAIGKPDDKRNRISLAGTLAGYVRREHVFSRPGPNTFGLLEFASKGANGTAEQQSQAPVRVEILKSEPIDEPPDDFGVTDDDLPF